MSLHNFPPPYIELSEEVLQSYPELKNIRITMLLKRKHPVPYGTAPTPASFFKHPKNREYHISILQEAPPPTEAVLFKNLPEELQKGVLAHELYHIIQFQACSRAKLLKVLMLYPFRRFRRKLERGADVGAILRGYGRELYKHALFIRSIPEYVAQRPELDYSYLLPNEIQDYMNEFYYEPAGNKQRGNAH